MSLVNITINDIPVSIEKGSTILDAAKKIKVKIPTLCHLNLHDIHVESKAASCRVCMVEASNKLVPACATLVAEGMQVKTNSARAINTRKAVLELLLSNHPADCLTCDKNTRCSLQDLASELGIKEIKYKGEVSHFTKDESSPSIIKDMNKCILCRRCETMCNEVQTVGVLSGVGRGFNTSVSTAFGNKLNKTNCTFCGQCVAVCPTAALTEVSNTSKVFEALNDDSKFTVVQIAPAVRVALGEEFGLESGSIVTGKIATALKKLGFDKVFDTDFAADLTIIEEASELIHRIQENHNLPLFTSCCPAWIKFIEHQYPEYLNHPSSCKSPQEMFGAIAKGYLAEKLNVNPENMTVVSIMPCIAKKYESQRDELCNDHNIADVDICITTREFAKMIKSAGIDFNSLEDSDFDNPLGESTGASVIFGATGGVLEAALRTAYEWITKSPLENLEFTSLRGIDGIKEASVTIGDLTLNVAVANGLSNARKIMEDMKDGKCNYHAVEIMACPGGCIGGAGQPYHHGDLSLLKKRMDGIYAEDRSKQLRKSHENESVKALYKEFLGEPYGQKSHKLLHTHYAQKAIVEI